MTTSILTTKLYIPPPPSNLVPRPRLIEKLNQGLKQKLTLVSAPAGFGKTTLLSECARFCGYPVAWISLDENDDDPIHFLRYLIAALQTLDHNIGEELINFLDSPQPPPVESMLTEIVNHIAKRSAHAVLVLDDYHVIESLEVDQLIAYFVSHMPPKMHLVIATRTDPILSLPRLRSSGQLIEIRTNDLRFSTKETALFLKKGIGLKISSEDIATLESCTEGWISGLQLAAISMQSLQDQREISRFVKNFSSSNRFILDYLTDEVLSKRPSGTKDFLLQNSILDRLSAPLCSVVTGFDNSQEILESLEAANLFLVPLDDERIWYRFHHLFGDLLRIRLERTTPDLIPELHRRASRWYAENNLIDQAISHSLAAEDFDRAALLTEQIFFGRMSRGEDFSAMMTRLVRLPEDIIRARPSLGIMYAWMLSITLQIDAVEPFLNEIETRFHGQLPVELQRQIATIRAEVCRHRGDYQKSIKGCLKVLESIPEERNFADQQTYTGIVTDLAWGYVLAGDMVQAENWFNKSLKVGQHSITLTLISLYGLSLVQELRGQLQQALDSCLNGLQLIEEINQKIENEVPAAIYIFNRLGNFLREKNQLEEAEHYFKLGLESGQKWNAVGDTMRDVYLDYSKLKLALGDFKGALDVLTQADRLRPHYTSVPGFGDTIEAHKARICVAWAVSCGYKQLLNAVEEWAAERELSADVSPRSINEEFEYLVLVRLLLAQNKSKKALNLLNRLIDSAHEKGRNGRVIEMRILQALAYRANGDTRDALNTLDAALRLAEPQGYIRLFVDEGPPMEAFLRQARVNGAETDYISTLLGALNPQETLEQQPSLVVRDPSLLVEPLSARELEVLQLLAEGATNQEIADELVIAVTTAKKHVSNIIGKLGVHNRLQAVTEARSLNLI